MHGVAYIVGFFYFDYGGIDLINLFFWSCSHFDYINPFSDETEESSMKNKSLYMNTIHEYNNIIRDPN